MARCTCMYNLLTSFLAWVDKVFIHLQVNMHCNVDWCYKHYIDNVNRGRDLITTDLYLVIVHIQYFYQSQRYLQINFLFQRLTSCVTNTLKRSSLVHLNVSVSLILFVDIRTALCTTALEKKKTFVIAKNYISSLQWVVVVTEVSGNSPQWLIV